MRKNREFETVYRSGRRLDGRGFSIHYLGTGRGFNRIGISVSRKVKGAVVRNRIKRIVRESFRLNRGLYPSNADIVFTVRPDFSLDSPDRITQAVRELVAAEPKRT